MKGDAAIDAPHAAAAVRATRPSRQKVQDTARLTRAAKDVAASTSPVEGRHAALGRIDREDVTALLEYGATLHWTCQQLLDAITAEREREST